ncbi:MAG: hypothetical protein OCC45_07490 [Desulfotalea sp.]
MKNLLSSSSVQAKNWQEYCEKLAIVINNQLIEKDYAATPVYIKPTCSDIKPCDEKVDNLCEQQDPCISKATTFDRVYKDLLTGKLMALGVPVKSSQTVDSIVIDYHTKIVEDNSSGFKGGEVVITNSIIKGGNYIFADSSIFVIEPKDFYHFHVKKNAYMIKVKEDINMAPISESEPELDSKTVEDDEIIMQPTPIANKKFI